jgi:hypothetical protein
MSNQGCPVGVFVWGYTKALEDLHLSDDVDGHIVISWDCLQGVNRLELSQCRTQRGMPKHGMSGLGYVNPAYLKFRLGLCGRNSNGGHDLPEVK